MYFDADVLGWRAIVEAWLTNRSPQEVQCLQKYFHQITDSIVDFVIHKSEYVMHSIGAIVTVSWVGSFSPLLPSTQSERCVQ